MNDAPIILRLVIVGAWVVLLAGATVSFWNGEWLHGGFHLTLLGLQIWIVAAVQRGSPPSFREKIGLTAVSILVLLLVVAIVTPRFVS